MLQSPGRESQEYRSVWRQENCPLLHMRPLNQAAAPRITSARFDLSQIVAAGSQHVAKSQQEQQLEGKGAARPALTIHEA